MSLSQRRIFVQEFHSSHVKSYTRDDHGVIQIISSEREGIVTRSVTSFLESVFLPAGYPESVSSDYIQYQIWDSLQAFCSSLTHTLATHAVLKGVGVGDASATPLAATITWLLKDGTGMLGSILFAFIRGSSLDSECKKWRLFADIVNDVSFLADLSSHHLPSYFLPIQCLSGVMRSLVGVAGGATRAAMTQHQARRNNLADVSAKDSSQETVVNLFALFFNLTFIPLLLSHSSAVWTVFSLFTFLHLFCNYKAVKSVTMEVFNLSRLVCTVESFSRKGRVLTPQEANGAENVWFFLPDSSQGLDVSLGVSLSQHTDLSLSQHTDLSLSQPTDLTELMEVFKREEYILSLHQGGKVVVSFKRSASSRDVIKSLFHALLLQSDSSFSLNEIEERFDKFVTECQLVGWSLEKQLFNCDEYRFECC